MFFFQTIDAEVYSERKEKKNKKKVPKLFIQRFKNKIKL
jgi:hypothetical protein